MAKFVDNSDKMLAQLERNIRAALEAGGSEAVSCVQDQIIGGYGRKIWQTGDLFRNNIYQVGRSGAHTVDVGNSMEYAIHVHDGTSRMVARPFLRDAILQNIGKIEQAMTSKLPHGIKD